MRIRLLRSRPTRGPRTAPIAADVSVSHAVIIAPCRKMARYSHMTPKLSSFMRGRPYALRRRSGQAATQASRFAVFVGWPKVFANGLHMEERAECGIGRAAQAAHRLHRLHIDAPGVVAILPHVEAYHLANEQLRPKRAELDDLVSPTFHADRHAFDSWRPDHVRGLGLDAERGHLADV